MTKPYWSFSNPAKAYMPKIVVYKYKTRFANGYGLNVILVSSDNVHAVKSKRYRISTNSFCPCTIADGGPVIMAKIFGVFGTKTCSFIRENWTKNGPLVFRTVLCSKHDEKLGN